MHRECPEKLAHLEKSGKFAKCFVFMKLVHWWCCAEKQFAIMPISDTVVPVFVNEMIMMMTTMMTIYICGSQTEDQCL